MKGIYRNLNAKKANQGSDIWTIANAHESNGFLVKETGVTHGVNFSLSNILINNPSSIAKGCKRIKAKCREVVALVGGNVGETKPTGAYLGRLTLDLQAESFLMVLDSGERVAFPNNVSLWFSATACEVYKN
jgi:hypothetical protein